MPYNINDYQPFREGQHPVFTSPENGCKHIGKNVNKQYIRHFKVDGEVFNGTREERCDFLLLNDESTPKTSYYIELKGSDLPKAIQQNENTIKLLSPALPGYVVLCRIVYHTGSHNVHASEVLRWKAKYKAVVKEREYSEIFDGNIAQKLGSEFSRRPAFFTMQYSCVLMFELEHSDAMNQCCTELLEGSSSKIFLAAPVIG